MPKNRSNGVDKSRAQAWLAGGIIIASLVTIAGLATAVILINREQAVNIFNIVIPVVSTWVGTILAYYFSKENFDAATQSVTELTRLTTQEKLKSIPVVNKMIPRDGMFYELITAAAPADAIKLVDMISRQEKAKKGLRIPILDEKFFPLYVIHRSVMDQYLTRRTLQGDDIKTITLKELLDDTELKKIIQDSFGVVGRTATLADVKVELEKSSSIQDVFITETGKTEEAILGFITNTMVEEYSIV